jgi:prolyl-tRNA synthetase
MMKDLYSVHESEEDFWEFYEKVKKAYLNSFMRIGFKTRVVEAAGGVFKNNNTHEFQVLTDGGEDKIYYCNKCDWAQNQEIFEGKVGEKCPGCRKGVVKESKSIEVGNIFPFGTYYSERMRVYFTDKEGKLKPMWFGSYGIGSTRAMGAWVEVSHDEAGIIWSKSITPFDVHLIELPGAKNSLDIYEKLISAGIDVLWDDRGVGAGEKFTDSDLIGIPQRLVISEKTRDKIEYKERFSSRTDLLSFDDVVIKLKGSK